MSLFIKQIADKLAGQVAFSLPTSSGYVNVVGFLSEDPVIKMGNRWEPLISDLGMINEFTQIAGIGQSSWISTSKMAWKGTDPITVTLNFYLITYLKSQVDGRTVGHIAPVSKQASYFAELAALAPDPGGGALGVGVRVHGGYNPNYFESNGTIVNNSNISVLKGLDESLSNTYVSGGDDGSHTCHIVINGNGRNSVVLKNMLLESLDMTPSTVRAGYWDINYSATGNRGKIASSGSFHTSGEPLYIKINAGFKLMRAAKIDDVKGLFGSNY